MRFLLTVTIGRQVGSPPAEFQAAMTRLVDDETRAGRFVLSGGLADGARIGVSNAELVRGGPRASIHGFAVVECPALEQAIEVASRLVRLHQELVPAWEVDCDVRPIVTHCLP